ncbi:MAG: GNAT family N-acetyltransferase [Solirubrobacterales bacterium]
MEEQKALENIMFRISFISNKNISKNILSDICEIKSIPWPYSLKSQLAWISNNISDNDIHVLLYNGEEFIAYLNLVEIEFSIDGVLTQGYGIGNVCSREKGKGYGSILMRNVNEYLKENDKIGLLLCKQELIPFYEKCSWDLISKGKLKLNNENKLVNAMTYNLIDSYCVLEYKGKLF